jgi:hypothetical protein
MSQKYRPSKFSVSMETAFEIIDGGGSIIDMGQISEATRRQLRHRMRQGIYEMFAHPAYPTRDAWRLRAASAEGLASRQRSS